MEALIEVRIAHSFLRDTVEEQARMYARPAADGPPAVRVLVSTTHDLSPAQADRLVADGAVVIILATMPRAAERRAYTAAGARYVPMSPGEARWTDCLDEVLRAPAREPVQVPVRRLSGAPRYGDPHGRAHAGDAQDS
jgi:hypothetical protein